MSPVAWGFSFPRGVSLKTVWLPGVTGNSPRLPTNRAHQDLPIRDVFHKAGKPDKPFDLAWGGWLYDYLDPAAMLTSTLEDSSAGPAFDDPAYQHRLAAAARLTGSGRYLTYGQLDLDLARYAAPLAACDNLTEHDFYSARIGCQTFGIYSMDLAALCTKRSQRSASAALAAAPRARRSAPRRESGMRPG